MGAVGSIEWVCVLCGCGIQSDWVSREMNLHQFCIKLEHYSAETIQIIQKDAAMSNWWLVASTLFTSHAEFFAKHQITQVTQPRYSPHLVPWHFCLFRKLKSHLKRKRFLTIDEIQENTMGQLIVIGRTMWGPKVPILKGTEASLSYTQSFLYFISSLINVYIFILHV